MIFANRREAGKLLADELKRYVGQSAVLVLALPRGGVPVAYEVAQALGVPLDVMVIRKLGAPGHEELALGAIASGGVRVVNDDLVRQLRIAPDVLEQVARREAKELARRERDYRGERPPLVVEGKTIILVDDGIATGASMNAAISALKQQAPKKLVIAVPTGAQESINKLRQQVDDIVCLTAPAHFVAVGQFYRDFSQTTDDEVRQLLAEALPR